MRIAYTIIYNGLHHLQHKGFSEFMAREFDYWIVIEGLSLAGGSTAWCKNLTLPGRSNDSTHEYMEAFAKQHSENVIYYSPGKRWRSKDDMVNEAVKITRMLTDECYLWQVDVDEIWTADSIREAEKQLESLPNKAASFQFNHFMGITAEGHQLIAHGEWGDGYNIRLWKWEGEDYIYHEPPTIQNQGEVAMLPQKYDHYSYQFERDVKFKSLYYQGHEYAHNNWRRMTRGGCHFPQDITALFGRSSRRFRRSQSRIEIYKPYMPCNTQKDVVAARQSHA